MNQSHPFEELLTKEESLKLSIATFLESFPDGAALICPDARVARINSRLEGILGFAEPGLCYRVLAGLSEICPFCPFDDLVSGRRVSIHGVVHERRGVKSVVSLRFIPEIAGTGMILETVRRLEEPTDEQDKAETDRMFIPGLLHTLAGLVRISRSLMSNLPFGQRMANVLRHLTASVDETFNSAVWVELDEEIYGSRPREIKGPLFVQGITVDGKLRGKVCANFPLQDRILPQIDYFLSEAADLIAQQVEISDLQAMLQQSEQRYKKLAGNLAKEMWSRTEALAKETSYLEGILRSSEDMIITTDLDSRIVEFNPAAEQILGFSAEDVQGRHVSEIWVDAEERERILEDVRTSGGIRNYETRLKMKSGGECEISLALSLLKDAEGRVLGTVGVSKDVGTEKTILRQLEQLNQNYREAIHFISHEAKNSLVVIGGFVRRLLETERDEVRNKQLAVVYHHSKFLEAMTRDYLVMAELEHGEFQVRKQFIKDFYNEVILPAMVGLKDRYPDSFQSYDDSMGGVGAIQLEGDQGLLEVVYRNLFGNALKYRNPGGKIAYGVVDLGNRYRFNVWNQGPGVGADQVERIFEKFYRVSDETTREKMGTGLGLYNIRKIIEAHGGRIWCQTNPGNWINFLFDLPKH